MTVSRSSRHRGKTPPVNLDRGDLNANKDAISGTPAWEEDWSLDMTGNWTDYIQKTSGSTDLDQDRDHNEVNEITEIDNSSTHVAHDKAGNMTKTPKPDNWSAHFDLTYDAWNRLVKVEDGEDTVADYEYDGRNYRTVKKTYDNGQLDETRHLYYNGGWQCLEERLGSGGQISTDPDRQFVWGLRYIDDLVLRDRDTDANGTLDERLYALQDPNWNVVALAETDGDIAERYTYDAYGKPTVLTPAFASRASSNYAWDTLYAGYRYDAETGDYHVRNRNLHHSLGVWNRRDPVGYSGDINLYRYCGSDPLTRSDPSGLGVISDLIWGYSCCTRTRIGNPIVWAYDTEVGPRANVEFFGPGYRDWEDWDDYDFTLLDVGWTECRVRWRSSQLYKIVCKDRNGNVVSVEYERKIKFAGVTYGRVRHIPGFGYQCDAGPP